MALTVASNLDRTNYDATLSFLGAHPIEHAALLALARRAQSTLSLRRRFALANDEYGSLSGVMFTGPQTLLSRADDAAARTFAATCSDRRPPQALIGPPDTVAQFLAESETGRPRIDHLQELYVLQHAAHTPERTSERIGEATVHDLAAIVPAAGEMIQEELGYDPRKRHTFQREILNQIESHRWWISQDAQLRAVCRIGAVTMETIQLECVWVPPSCRGQGYGKRAIATICARLLARRSTVSLAVNAHNDTARGLYERLGFTLHGSQRTVLW